MSASASAASSARTSVSALALGTDRHAYAGRQLVETVRRERFVALQSVHNLPEIVLADAKGDRLLRDLAVLNDVDRRDTGERRDGGVRHGQYTFVAPREDHALGKESRLQTQVGIVDERF